MDKIESAMSSGSPAAIKCAFSTSSGVALLSSGKMLRRLSGFVDLSATMKMAPKMADICSGCWLRASATSVCVISDRKKRSINERNISSALEFAAKGEGDDHLKFSLNVGRTYLRQGGRVQGARGKSVFPTVRR